MSLDTIDGQTTISEASAIVPDFYGRSLHRALDKKVQALRTMLLVDEDIASELDRVVCRLMRLALLTSNGKQEPPPPKWMQCKLLDLLTLTEKAITRRKKHFIDNFPLKSISFDKNITILNKMIKEDQAARMIVDKYNHLLQEAENQENFNDLNFGFEDEISEQLESNECLKDFALDDIKYTLKPYVVDVNNGEISNIEDNLEIAYPDHITSDSSNGARKKYVKEETRISRKRSYTKITGRTYKPEDKNSKSKKSKTNVFRKKPVRAKTSNSFLIMKGKKVTNEYGNYGLKSRRVKTSKNFEPTASKPIPGSLIELCEPRMNLLLHSKNFQYTSSAQTGHDPVKNPIIEVAATEESVLIDIVMDDMEETIALRRSIGTDADNTYLTVHEQEATLGNVTNVTRNSSNKQHVSVESIQSETIFLYDINEPSTSKGIRHNVSMDVQCGTDAILPTRGLVTPLTSPMKLPKLYSGGIKIDSMTNFATEKKSVDFGTCTISVTKNCNTCYTPCMFPKGIEIEDLQHNLKKKVSNIGTSTADAINECKLPLTHSSRIRLKDSFNDMSAERFSHFNMITCEENDQWLPKSATMKSSGTMTEIISENDGYGTRRSVSPEELTSITPRTKSHDLLTSSRMDDSLSNLLVNFYETDARHTGSRERFPNARSRSPDAVYTSPDAKNRSPAARYRSPDAGYRSPDARNRSPARKTSFNARNRSPDLRHKSYYACGAGIKIKDSATDTRNLNKVNCSTSTIGDSKTNKIFSRPESPVVYTRVKMIDLISNVTIEQDTEIEPFGLPEPCKLVSSTYIPERPPECRFKIKNSSHVKHSLTRDIDTCIDNSNEKLDNKAHKYTKDEHSNDKTENHDYDTSGTVITNDSFTKVPMKSVNLQADFFDKNASALPLTQSFGFKVKGFDENVIKKVEFSATRVELVSETANFWPPTQLGSSTKTELLKAVSSRIKVEDSASELYGSNYCPSPKSLWQGTISTLNSKQSLSRDMNCHSKESPTKLTRCKLSCGGVHIHSFKEKQISEDVVYQGEWKRHVPKYPRKYQGNTIVAKKVSETSKKNRTKLRQEKLQVKKVEIKNEHIKPLQVRNTNPARIKRDVNNKCEQIKKVALPNLANVIKENRKTITKVASKIMTSTPKNIKSMRLPKKLPNHVTLTPFVKNDFIVKSEPIKTNDLDYKYLPTYLRRRKSASGQSKQTINNIIDTNKTTIINEDNTKNDLPSLARSKSELIQSDLLKLQDETFSSTNYLVFRNEKENTNPPANSSQSADITNTNETTITRKSIHKRLSNPISPTSSACSTSDSISTVRATNNWTGASRRRSTSSNKSSMANTDSETSPSANKTRKFSKKSKANKKSDGKDHNNKENVPESSKKRFPEKGICLQNMKSAFMGRNKNIFMAKLNDSGLALSEKHKNSTKSNIKTPAIEVNDDKKRLKSSGFSKKLSNDSITKEYVIRNHDSIQFDASNKVLLIEPLKDHVKIQENISQHVTPEEQILKVVDSQLLTEWFERGKVSVIDRESTENAILAQMRQLVEERLDFIATSLNDSSIELEDNSSLKSYKTMVPAEDTDLDSSLKSEIENAMNHSLDAVLGGESDFSMQKQSSIDFDLISFQSLASTSRYSDYYLAESNISKNEDNTENINVSSVLDIFERKDLNALVQNAPGPLAVQAFSGFSMNVDHVMGDQPDYIPVMDSQTGSLAVTRQTTSEEMFVSERSSETYESCTLEEEVSVPDWLFHVMNPHLSMESDQHPDLVAPFDSETGSPARGYSRPRHQTINEEEDQELLPLRMPLVEPVLDENGNVMEPGIGLGAGAGDGRGMHSDHSQDSSGRGSSLSSTDASSGQQSEAVLIDPSAFTTQFEMFHEPVGSSMAVTTLVVPARSSEADRQHGRNEGAIMSTSRNATIRTVHPPLTSSDGEADVSSLDTDDIPDSS